MAEKIKILKKDVPFLKRDLELEPDVVEELTKLQEDRQKKFQDKIEASRKEAQQKYIERIKMLEKAKAEAVKNYDDEIEKYQQLVKSMKEQDKKVVPKKPGRGKVTKPVK